MATDRQAKGITIKTYAGDAPTFGKGDIWFNTVTNKLRCSAINAAGGVWTSAGTTPIQGAGNGVAVGDGTTNTLHYSFTGTPGAPIPAATNAPVSYTFNAPTTTWTQTAARNTNRATSSGTGSSYTAALNYGGTDQSPATKPFTNSKQTEEWNGTTWTQPPATLPIGQNYAAGFGNSTEAALIAGGESDPTPPGGPHSTAVQYFNGTSWTTVGSLNQSRRYLRGFGSSTSGLVFGGDTDIPTHPVGRYTLETESWNGTSWTEVSDLPQGRISSGVSGGSNSSGLIFGDDGGAGAPTTSVLYWNGTAWTAGTAITTGGSRPAGAGNGGAGGTAIAAFGGTGFNTVEIYDFPGTGSAFDIDFS